MHGLSCYSLLGYLGIRCWSSHTYVAFYSPKCFLSLFAKLMGTCFKVYHMSWQQLPTVIRNSDKSKLKLINRLKSASTINRGCHYEACHSQFLPHALGDCSPPSINFPNHCRHRLALADHQLQSCFLTSSLCSSIAITSSWLPVDLYDEGRNTRWESFCHCWHQTWVGTGYKCQ